MIKIIHAWLVYTWGGLHRYFGNANSLVREHERAAHYFAKAYEIDPTFRAARLQRAVLLCRELGRHEEAIREFDALLADDPSYGDALFNRGITLQEIGRFQQALVDLDHYLQLPDQNEYQSEANRLSTHLREIVKDLPR
jgi:tetratricopeptide (TPR) repeat protein